MKATSNAYWGMGSYLKREIGRKIERLNPFRSKALVPTAASPKAKSQKTTFSLLNCSSTGDFSM